jgi:S-adenosylmethionine hydrolase
MPRPIITLMTDFGIADSYVAQMKGTILGINPDATLVDVTHQVPPQQVARGAFVLDEIVEAFPESTIHLAVVDPGVGGERALLAVEMGRWRFVAPDNGLLTNVARRYAPRRVIRIENRRYFRATVSPTFHGRDIMAPVAAHWSLGVDAAEFGTVISGRLISLPESKAEILDDVIVGEVLWSDSFGNLITSIEESQIPPTGRSDLCIECAGRTLRGLRSNYSEGNPGELLALIGSSGRLEIAVRDGNAARVLGISNGEKARVRVPSEPSTRRERNDR